MNNSLISVIISTYNREEYIKRAIESALNQTYENIEIIVVDDNSTDNTKSILEPYIKTKKIRYFYQSNTGPGVARNNGIKDSRGKYIAILDDDDFWCDKKKLEKQVAFLEKYPNYVLVGGGIIKVNKEEEEIARYLFPENDKEIRKSILFENAFAHSTVLFRKDIWEKIGGYDNEFDSLEDWDLWLKIGRVSKFYNFQEFFAYYLGHGHNDPGYAARKYENGKRIQLKLNVKLRKKYRNDYPHYKKAFLLCWVSYFHFFLPFRQKLHPMLLKLRTLFFGPSAYKYIKK